MLSKERQLPAPLTSSVHLSLEADPAVQFCYQPSPTPLNADLLSAVHDKDVASMRALADKLSLDRHFEAGVSALIHEYASKKDAERCALVLKHVAVHAGPMLSFWVAMSYQDAPLLRWVGQYDELARYIFLPMPCPNREWCLEHHVDRNNPGPLFRQWWSQYREPLRRAVDDHLRVEWLRRFTAQPKLYHLLDQPTREQAVFVATRPEAIWDMPVLAVHYPDIESVYNVTHSLYQGVAARQQMAQYLSMGHGRIAESYELPI